VTHPTESTMKQRTFPEPQAFSAQPRPPIELLAVNSSQVKAVGYDPATKTLAVTFNRGQGAIYHYPDVSPELHAQFLAAESMGRFHGEHIKHLPFVKFPAEEVAA
jgi:hypothetical protein